MATEVKQRNNRIFVIIGVVVAAAAFLGSLYLSRSGSSSSTSGATSSAPVVHVVVATADIPKGTKIDASQLTVQDRPQDQVPVGAPQDSTGLVGKYVSVDVKANSVMQVSYIFNDLNSAQAAVATVAPMDIHAGFVALAMPVSGNGAGFTANLVTVGGYIQADDHIDIIIDAGNGSTRYSLQDIRVLRVGSSGTAAPAAGAAAAAPDVYIVEVNRAQAELLTYLTTGRGPQTVLRYVLRAKDDYGKSTGAKYMATTDPGIPTVADPPVDPNSFGKLFPPK